MKKFLLGILTGLVLAVLTVLIVGFSLVRVGERRPSVSDNSTLILRLEGDIPEKSPVQLPIPFLGGPTPLTVGEIWTSLQRATTDGKVKALVLNVGRMDAGWAKVLELRNDIVKFKSSGKPVYAIVRAPGMREYYLATAADRIYAAPEDMVDVKGLRAEMMFVKNTLDKIGVQVEVEHVGKYKDAGDMLTSTSMSPESREATALMLDGIYSDVLQTIAAGRKRSVAEIRAIIDEGPFTAKQAADKGLLDALRYEDQVFGELKDRLKSGEIKKTRFQDYVAATPPAGKRRVALLVGEGTITRSAAGEDAMGTDEGFTSGAFIRMVRAVANDRSIDGVILRVNSPGGDAFASDEMLREIQLLREKKPTVISMSDYAASGGYYVSMTGDPILAYPTTITGSIGVLFVKPNLRGLYDKLGIQKEMITRGKNAAIDSDYGPMTPEARQKLQSGLQEFYHGFVTKVAQSRKRSYEEVEPLAQGRVWLGMHAKNNRLVDQLGGLDQALELVKAKAKIPAGDTVRVIPYPGKRSLLEQWLLSTQTASLESRVRSVLGIESPVPLSGGVMRVMPYRVEVK